MCHSDPRNNYYLVLLKYYIRKHLIWTSHKKKIEEIGTSKKYENSQILILQRQSPTVCSTVSRINFIQKITQNLGQNPNNAIF